MIGSVDSNGKAGAGRLTGNEVRAMLDARRMMNEATRRDAERRRSELAKAAKDAVSVEVVAEAGMESVRVSVDTRSIGRGDGSWSLLLSPSEMRWRAIAALGVLPHDADDALARGLGELAETPFPTGQGTPVRRMAWLVAKACEDIVAGQAIVSTPGARDRLFADALMDASVWASEQQEEALSVVLDMAATELDDRCCGSPERGLTDVAILTLALKGALDGSNSGEASEGQEVSPEAMAALQNFGEG